MEQVAIGKILKGGEQRDAIHIAIAPVMARDKLAPGQDIGFIDPANPEVVGPCDNPVGIVDPFLKGMVYPMQRIYMFLYPNTVTGMRHEWTHPAFKEPQKAAIEVFSQRISDAKAWLEKFGEEYNLTCDELVEVVQDCRKNGGYHRLGFDTPNSAYSDRREFWRNYEIVTGERVDDHDDGLPFSCSC